MPEFMVTSPEGKQYRITAPEGTTKDQALAKFQETQQGDAAGGLGKPLAKKGGSGLWNTAADFFKSIPTGLAQGTRAPGAFGTQGPLEEDPTQAARETATKQLHQPQGFAGRVGAAAGEAATNPMTFNPAGSAAKTALGIGGAIVGGQAGSEIGEKVGGTTGGVIGGLAGGIAGGGGAARLGGKPPVTAARTNVTKPIETNNATMEAAANTVRKFGVEPDAGTLRQSPGLRNAQQLGGDIAVHSAEKQLTSAGSTLMGTMGDNISPRMLENNTKRLKGDFEKSLQPLSITRDEQLHSELTALREDMLKRAEPEQQGKIDALLADAGLGWDELEETGSRAKKGPTIGAADAPESPHRAKWQPNPQGQDIMTGKDYHSFVKTGSKLDNAIHSANSDVREYANNVRNILDSALERSSNRPDQKQALALFKKTKEEYFNQKVINEAIVREAKHGRRVGTIDAEKLYNHLQTYGWDGGVPKTKLQELAAGAVSTVPASKSTTLGAGHEAGTRGTARGIGAGVGGALGGAIGSAFGGFGAPVGAGIGASIGGAAGPYLAGRAANSKMVQNYAKKNREITAAARAKVRAPEVGRNIIRGAVGAMSAQQKKKKERQRIYEGGE